MQYKIASRTVVSESGIPRRFDYFLLTEVVLSAHFGCEQYGVHISDSMGNTACVPRITTDPTKMDELMTLLVDQLVGPLGLADVVRDWLAQEKSGVEAIFDTAG